MPLFTFYFGSINSMNALRSLSFTDFVSDFLRRHPAAPGAYHPADLSEIYSLLDADASEGSRLVLVSALEAIYI